jgi:hypothetical protein
MEDFKIIFIGIVFIVILKYYKFINKVEKIKINQPTLEYYEWKKLYFKMMVLNKLYKKRNHTNKKSIE